jgi:hypothetical protein
MSRAVVVPELLDVREPPFGAASCVTAPSITRAEQGDRRLCQRAVVHDVRTAQEQKFWASWVRTSVVVLVPERLTHSMSAWAPSPSGP